jgi:hypothetical protein
MQLDQQGGHTNETGYGEDGNRERGFFEDCEARVSYVIHKCQGLYYVSSSRRDSTLPNKEVRTLAMLIHAGSRRQGSSEPPER